MTEQEEFWRGEFGDSYSHRNAGEALLKANAALFLKALAFRERLGSVIEFGANCGLNLQALHGLWPHIDLTAIEINKTACLELQKLGYVEVRNGSILQSPPNWGQYDLSLSKGLLIHIAPEDLGKAYDALFRSSRRYILLAEYFNPTPVAIEYRGNKGKLWKRDFCAEMLDRYHGLKLVDYGFVYARDPVAPLDNITWWLLEREAA